MNSPQELNFTIDSRVKFNPRGTNLILDETEDPINLTLQDGQKMPDVFALFMKQCEWMKDYIPETQKDDDCSLLSVENFGTFGHGVLIVVVDGYVSKEWTYDYSTGEGKNLDQSFFSYVWDAVSSGNIPYISFRLSLFP